MKRAFTLIELLVVIAIIALIAAILFPVFGRVREKSRQTSCMSNQKQLGLGVLQYLQDFDEHYPNGCNRSGVGTGWASQIYPYVKSKAVYVCPSDTSSPADTVSYGYNRTAVYVPGGAPGDPSGRLLSEYRSPSKTVLLYEVAGTGTVPSWMGTNCDVSLPPYSKYTAGKPIPDIVDTHSVWSSYYSGCSVGGYGQGTAFDPYSEVVSTGPTNPAKYATGYMVNSSQSASYFDSPTGRHTEGSCYLMADGHAKWLPPSKVASGYNNNTNGSCGTPGTAANTNCTTIDVTFSIY